MPTISKRQVAKLRTLAHKRFGACSCKRPDRNPDCDYHAWLWDTFAAASTLDLNRTQTQQAIDALEGRPARKPRPDTAREAEPWRGRYASAGTDGRATQAQLDEIARLEDSLGWSGSRDALQRMIRRQLGRPPSVFTPPQMLAGRQASSLVTGMRRLLAHNRTAA